jgi:Ca-activated chloride channel family protein
MSRSSRFASSTRAVVRHGAWLVLVLIASLPMRAQAWEPFRSANRDVDDGNALLGQGKAKEALEAYERAARTLPEAPGVHLNRGLAWLAAGDPVRAREALRTAANADEAPELRAQAYYNLGLAFYAEGDALSLEGQHGQAQQRFREAADAFKGSLRLGPGSRDAGWNLELALRRIADEQEKIEQEKAEQEKAEQEKKDDGGSEAGDDDENRDPGEQQGEPQSDGSQKPEGGDRDPSQEQQKPEEKSESGSDSEAPKDGRDEQRPDTNPEPPQDADKGAEPQAPPPQQAPAAGDAQNPPPQLPADVARALDALQAGEQNLEQLRARMRAGSQRPPAKDW